MIAVEAPSPAHWVRGLATVVRTGGSNGENDFSLHNADGALHDDCDDGEKSEPLGHHSAPHVQTGAAAAAAGLQQRQRRRASIGNVFHRSASPPPPPAPQEYNAVEGRRGPRPRQGRRSTVDMTPSYDPHVYASAYGTHREHDSGNSRETSDDEGSQHDTKMKRDRSVSGLEHFEHILAMEEEEEAEQNKERKERKGTAFPWQQSQRTRSDSNASNRENPAADDSSSQQDSACMPAAAHHPVASRQQPRRRVSNEDVRDVILNDDISWHNIRVEIRRARLVTSLGVAQVCRSYVSSERGEAARQRIIKRRSMDHVMNSSGTSLSNGGCCNESLGQASAASAGAQEQGNGRMRRRLSLF